MSFAVELFGTSKRLKSAVGPLLLFARVRSNGSNGVESGLAGFGVHLS